MRKKTSDKTKPYKIETAKSSNNHANKRVNSKNSKSSKSKKAKNTKNKKSTSDKKKHPKLKLAIKICLIAFAVLCLIGIGILAAVFFGDQWEITADDLVISMENSEVYDIDGEKIAELTGDENRKIISLSEMGEYIPNAFVAIEDERFYSHSGIDVKRTAGAIVTYVLNGGSSSFGGSTITQQLVKNMMEDDASTGIAGVERKIREWSRAYQIEQMLSKSQILELYLNKIFMGGTVYGVESASQYYFSKSADELSLAESAFLAGINHSPNSYNPFGDSDNSEKIKSRTLTVLEKMRELGDTDVEELVGLTQITDEQYEEAIAEVEAGLNFEKGTLSDNSNISYHTEAAIDEIASELAEEKDVNYETARSMILSGGYKIYTTQDSDIQDIMEEEYSKSTYVKAATTEEGIENDEHSQSAMVIIDQYTGQVVGTVGGLGEENSTTTLGGYNRATDIYRQPGSSIKPLAAVGPALEEGVITAATLYDDSKTTFGGDYSPSNSTGYPGIISVRAAVERSSNIVNIKILSNLGVSTAIEYLQEFGLSKYNMDDDGFLSLALGGTGSGTNALQMAAAYATIANGGTYIEPTFYTKVENSSGEVVIETSQETRRVLSESTAYVLTNILTSPVYGFYGSNTASGCAISGIETAAKTGTTSSYRDKWLCGMTPYYTAATWFGFDTEEAVKNIGGTSNPAKAIWANVMKEVHADLEDADFEVPSGVVTAKICKTTGMVATSKCSSTYTEYFVTGTVPDSCTGHDGVEVCTESGLLATEYCPETETKYYSVTPEKEINANWTTSSSSSSTITEYCDVHTEDSMTVTVPDVIGMTEKEAKSALSDFTVTVVTGQNSAKDNGVVLKQSLDAGATATKGDSITITVNQVTTSGGSSGNDDDDTEDENDTSNDTEEQDTGQTNTDTSSSTEENEENR